MALITVQPAPVEFGEQTVPLLSISIDGTLVSDQFPPFDSSAISIGTSTCLECFVATGGEISFCGSYPDGMEDHDVIGIRRFENKIVWFHQHDQWSCPLVSGFPAHHMWHFEVSEYESQLGGDSSAVPEFNSLDIQRVIGFSQIPESRQAVCRTPLCDFDPTGRELLGMINGIAVDDGLRIPNAPSDVLPYEIEIERNCDPEVAFEAGLSNGEYSVRLIRNPTFPFWLTSSYITEQMSRVAGQLSNVSEGRVDPVP